MKFDKLFYLKWALHILSKVSACQFPTFINEGTNFHDMARLDANHVIRCQRCRGVVASILKGELLTYVNISIKRSSTNGRYLIRYYCSNCNTLLNNKNVNSEGQRRLL